jgi:hypothetical protein
MKVRVGPSHHRLDNIVQTSERDASVTCTLRQIGGRLPSSVIFNWSIDPEGAVLSFGFVFDVAIFRCSFFIVAQASTASRNSA